MDHTEAEALYAAIPFLAEIASDGEGDEMDRVPSPANISLNHLAAQV